MWPIAPIVPIIVWISCFDVRVDEETATRSTRRMRSACLEQLVCRIPCGERLEVNELVHCFRPGFPRRRNGRTSYPLFLLLAHLYPHVCN